MEPAGHAAQIFRENQRRPVDSYVLLLEGMLEVAYVWQTFNILSSMGKRGGTNGNNGKYIRYQYQASSIAKA